MSLQFTPSAILTLTGLVLLAATGHFWLGFVLIILALMLGFAPIVFTTYQFYKYARKAKKAMKTQNLEDLQNVMGAKPEWMPFRDP